MENLKAISFEGFLLKYLKDLSGENTSSIRKLANEVGKCPRLREPLILYCYFFVERTTAKRLLYNSDLYTDFLRFVDRFPNFEDAMTFLQENELSNDAFAKVYHSYWCYANRTSIDNQLKQKMLENIQKLQKEKNISTNELLNCEALELNKENFRNFLRGDMSALSCEKVFEIFCFVKGVPKYTETQRALERNIHIEKEDIEFLDKLMSEETEPHD